MKIKLCKLIFKVFFLFQPFILIPAQNLNDYNKIYTKTYLETSQKDHKKALKIADSLFTISETPHLKAKSLMLSATLLQQTGDIKQAIYYATQAEQAIEKSDKNIYKSIIYGFLATQYRNIQLYEFSKEYTDKALHIADKIEDPKSISSIIGLIWQEKAYYELEKKNYAQSINCVNKSQEYFQGEVQNKDFLTANNNQLLGLAYFHTKKFAKALLAYQKALQTLDTMPDNFLKGFVLNGMSEIYIETKNVTKAKEYMIRAEKIAEQSDYLYLKKEIYKTSKKYYTLTKDIKKLEQADVKQDSLVDLINRKSSVLVNDTVAKLNKKQTQTENKGNTKDKIILSSLLIITIGSVNVLIRKRKQKNNKKTQLLLDLKNKEISNKQIVLQNTKVVSSDITENKQKELKSEPDKMIMSLETKQKILNRLEKFEKSTLFNRKNTSLSFLTSYCDTNAKYLSYVINTHKQKDVTNYINDLRIAYILKKIQEDSKYKKLKISALAEETGFSTQSKFALAFKKVTSVSPSVFLNSIPEEDKVDL